MAESTQDLRFGLRLLLKRPGFSLLVVVMLAAGIGINTAVFSVVDAFLLRPLPFPAADRLVKVESVRGDGEAGVSFPDYVDWRARSRSFMDLAFLNSSFVANVSFGGETETAQATLATWNLFPMLAARPVLGRWFLPEEDQPGAPCVVLLSQGLWARRFGADRRILGRKILLEDSSCVVVGVMPGSFKFPAQTEVWSPIGPLVNRENRSQRFDSVIGRLRSGVSVAQAREEMAAVARALEQEYPRTNGGVGASVVPLRDVWVGDIRRSLLLLLGACSFLLLMTCANVANLLLGRALAREREMAIRTSLGADWPRLVRQLTLEHLILAACGGTLGLALAYVGVAVVGRALPSGLPFWLTLGINRTAVLYTLFISVAVGLLFGLAPILQIKNTNLTSSLKEGRAVGGDRSRRALRASLVVLEIALALVLLLGARLMVTSFLRLRQVDPGFRFDRVIVADLNLTFHEGGGREHWSQLVQAVLTRVSALPGVESVGADSTLPLASQDVWDRQIVTLFGQGPDQQRLNPVLNFQNVSPDYFKTLNIGLVRGRVFGPQDVVGQPRVALVGAEAARRLWPKDDPIGRRIKLGAPASEAEWMTVIGIVRDVHQQSLAEAPGCDLFAPILQVPRKRFSVLVRASGDPGGLARAVRETIEGTSAEVGVLRIRTLEDVIAQSIWEPRLWGWLFAVFSLVSLVLAAAGVYGVMASSVNERAREIGIRMALGARRSRVLKMMLGYGLKLAVIGALLGLSMAIILSNLMANLLFEVKAGDPWKFLEVASFLAGVVLLASWLPSRRAMQVDPLTVLRQE